VRGEAGGGDAGAAYGGDGLTPKRKYQFFVYILGSRSRNLYVGLTNNLRRRVSEHREHTPGSHTAEYNIDRLLYFERFQYVRSAIAREKEIKDWNRALKVELIEKVNPTWEDLAAEW
jgi:putative endonuclease